MSLLDLNNVINYLISMDAVSDKFQIMTDIQLYLNKVQPYHM